MAFTLQSEIDLVNESLDYLGAATITLAVQTSVAGVKANLHYEKLLHALLRSYLWPFAKAQTELYQTKTMTLDVQPTSAFSVDDTITGISSGVTADILAVTSNTEYDIIHVTGNFTDGETITNATVETVYWEGIEVTYESETVYSYDVSDDSQVNCGIGYPSVVSKSPNHKWTYIYELPDDFVRLVSIEEDDGTDYRGLRWDIFGHTIYTDYDTCNIDYIKQVSDPDDFDDLFYQLMVLKLAQKLLPAIAGTKSKEFKNDLRNDIRTLEAAARTIGKQERTSKGRSDWNLARLGGTVSTGNIDNA
jgi:hypothetical protein